MFIYHFFKSHVSYIDNKSKNKEIIFNEKRIGIFLVKIIFLNIIAEEL